jgi:hypothetical protein
MRLHIILILLINTYIATAQKKNNSTSSNQLIDNLVTMLQQDPDNPLKIDSESLQKIAGGLPEGTLKQKMLTYSQNIGIDNDLSMRQVYWDLGVAFNNDNLTTQQAEYQKMGTSLNLLLQSPEKLAEKLGITSNLGNGMFFNDPAYRATLSEATGIPNMNQDTAMGVTLAVASLAALQGSQQFKEDYKKYAKMSWAIVYSEADHNLSKNLIDAAVLKAPYNFVTSLYRYDFDNGSTLSVENGILILKNSKSNLSKKLATVIWKNDGNSGFEEPHMVRVEISDDENFFTVTTGKNPHTDSGLEKKEGYIINSLTGEAITYKDLYTALMSTAIIQPSFNNQKLEYYYPYYASLLYNEMDFKKKQDSKRVVLPNEDNFLIKNKTRKSSLLEFFPYAVKSGNELLSLMWAYGKDDTIHLGPVDETIYSSSFLYGDKFDNKKGLNIGVTNKLTGLTSTKSGDLFFTTANGQIGKISGSTHNLENAETLLKTAQTSSFAKAYDFIIKDKYLFNGGRSIIALPKLMVSGDEKWLVYLVDYKMYLINTSDITITKEFDLTAIPFGSFFTKENGDYVLNLVSLNQFKIPVIKKYSFSGLCKSQKIIIPAKKASASDAKQSTISISEEIKSLKALLDEGTITEEEFMKAKNKLLKTN